jgi:hypothetical protein
MLSLWSITVDPSDLFSSIMDIMPRLGKVALRLELTPDLLSSEEDLQLDVIVSSESRWPDVIVSSETN